MPTDGTLFLENVPKKKQYLLTGLSVFFSFGGVIAAIVGIIIIPGNSCPERGPSGELPSCDVETQNQGWKHMFGVLTVFVRITSE